jgi:hypothetical protein
VINLEKIRDRLKRGYDYIIYPSAMGDIPITLKKMEKCDQNGKVIGHYTINELSKLLGDDFNPEPYIMNGLMMIHWSFDETVDPVTLKYERDSTRDLLLSKGLVDMRAGASVVKDIDFQSLNGNEFGIFGSYEILDVPKQRTEVALNMPKIIH